MVVRKYEGYAERMRGDMREDEGGYAGYAGYAGRTTSPKSARPGCRFWTSPPQSTKDGETGTANDLQAEKGMLILYLTC